MEEGGERKDNCIEMEHKGEGAKRKRRRSRKKGKLPGKRGIKGKEEKGSTRRETVPRR